MPKQRTRRNYHNCLEPADFVARHWLTHSEGCALSLVYGRQIYWQSQPLAWYMRFLSDEEILGYGRFGEAKEAQKSAASLPAIAHVSNSGLLWTSCHPYMYEFMDSCPYPVVSL